MTQIPFLKMHGIGNDFVVVDGRNGKLPVFAPALIMAICDRYKGIGCDQFVLLQKPKKADLAVKFFNADGSPSGTCGNASRCVAWLLMEETGTSSVTIETDGGLLECTRAGDASITVNMGKYRTKWSEVPLAEQCDTLKLPIGHGPLQDPVAVSMGNPHAVFFVDDLKNLELEKYAPSLEHHAIFPERANIGAAQVCSDSELDLRVWERGTGETLACGSGACAAAVAAHRRGLTGRNVTINLPGGTLQIRIADSDEVFMTGPVATSFSGIFNTKTVGR